jgi:hypothetical protein
MNDLPHPVRRALSEARLRPYLDACQQDVGRAMELYEWNARLSAAWLSLLEAVEVTTRNLFNDELCSQYGNDWYDHVAHPQVITHKVSRDNIDRARGSLRRIKKRETTGRVVAELSFGFWVALTRNNYQHLWRQALHRAFHGTPPPLKDVRQPLQRLNKLRNRVGHHEPVWHLPHTDLVDDARQLLAGFHPDIAAWYADRVDAVRDVHTEDPT